ncbi:MAG: amidohydrolase family protein [Acidobacteria bacterium]|nr:amidohydrolase family protein [Acidobacteriota bacterium]
MDLSTLPVVDQHAHSLLTAEAAARLPLAAALTEATDPRQVEHTRHSLTYRRSVSLLAGLLSCEDREDTVLRCRRSLDWTELTRRCLTDANLQLILMDDGFPADESLPLEWHRQFVPVRRILRLERLAEDILAASRTFSDFHTRLTAALDNPPPDVCAFKSIAAYRGGLDFQTASAAGTAACFEGIRSDVTAGRRVRLVHQPLIHFAIELALSAALRHGFPLQFHTGLGDTDLDLRLANPLHLRPLLEDRRWADVPIVILHAGWPFCREAAYLAAVYPQVYVDFGLVVPLLSRAGMRSALRRLLELAPATKILFSSDAHSVPELYWLGARLGRETVAAVLEESVHQKELLPSAAEELAVAILRDNAHRLYRL